VRPAAVVTAAASKEAIVTVVMLSFNHTLLSFDPTNLTISALEIYSKCLIGDGEWKIIEGDSILRKDIYQRAQIVVKVDIPDDADSATLWKFRLKDKSKIYDRRLNRTLDF
jgi:hypothetical protein